MLILCANNSDQKIKMGKALKKNKYIGVIIYKGIKNNIFIKKKGVFLGILYKE